MLATVLMLACAFTTHPTQAREPGVHALGPEWIAIDPARLAAMRGGYELPSGLVLSFAIERAVYVNGELVASSRISIPDPSQLTAEQARSLSALGDTLLVQVGQGNSFQAGGSGGVVVQNTLDNQNIRTLTAIDLNVGSLGLLQDLNANAALQQGILNAVGGP